MIIKVLILKRGGFVRAIIPHKIMVVPVFILGRTNHRALKTIPLFSNLNMNYFEGDMVVRFSQDLYYLAFYFAKCFLFVFVLYREMQDIL